jgi:hypothetical protein
VNICPKVSTTLMRSLFGHFSSSTVSRWSLKLQTFEFYRWTNAPDDRVGTSKLSVRKRPIDRLGPSALHSGNRCFSSTSDDTSGSEAVSVGVVAEEVSSDRACSSFFQLPFPHLSVRFLDIIPVSTLEGTEMHHTIRTQFKNFMTHRRVVGRVAAGQRICPNPKRKRGVDRPSLTLRVGIKSQASHATCWD